MIIVLIILPPPQRTPQAKRVNTFRLGAVGLNLAQYFAILIIVKKNKNENIYNSEAEYIRHSDK